MTKPIGGNAARRRQIRLPPREAGARSGPDADACWPPQRAAAGLHADRAPGGDHHHPDRQRRRLADRAAGLAASPGQRGGADPSGRPGRRPRRGHQEQRRAASASCPTRRSAASSPAHRRSYRRHPAAGLNRIIPIGAAPDYTEGLVSIYATAAMRHGTLPLLGTPTTATTRTSTATALASRALMLEESVVVLTPRRLPNAPTSWFWNIRVGDKIQINNAGPWYTVVGPMALPPQGCMTDKGSTRITSCSLTSARPVHASPIHATRITSTVRSRVPVPRERPGRQRQRLGRRGLGRSRQQPRLRDRQTPR